MLFDNSTLQVLNATTPVSSIVHMMGTTGHKCGNTSNIQADLTASAYDIIWRSDDLSDLSTGEEMYHKYWSRNLKEKKGHIMFWGK